MAKSNPTDAWIDAKELIDIGYPTFPRHQGTTDITEIIEFARIATEHNLTNRQYDQLIGKAEQYYKELERKRIIEEANK